MRARTLSSLIPIYPGCTEANDGRGPPCPSAPPKVLGGIRSTVTGLHFDYKPLSVPCCRWYLLPPPRLTSSKYLPTPSER